MALLKSSEPWMQDAVADAQRRIGDRGRLGRAARSELALRNGMEDLMRQKMPAARMCHEMVMGAGKVRADLVAVGTDHIAAVEVKGGYDDTSRLLHQIGMYQLCVPEVWMVVDTKHRDDAKLIRHLLPSVGLIVADGLSHLNYEWDETERPVIVEVVDEAISRAPVPEMTLEMLWAAELTMACRRLGLDVGSRATRPQMMARILKSQTPEQILREACTALRGRDALWRADAPIDA